MQCLVRDSHSHEPSFEALVKTSPTWPAPHSSTYWPVSCAALSWQTCSPRRVSLWTLSTRSSSSCTASNWQIFLDNKLLKYDINTFWGPGTKIFSEQFPQVPMWTVLQWWNTQSLWKCTWRVLVLHFYHSHRVKTLILPWFKSEMKWEISYRTGLPSSEYSICWASDSDERRLVNSQCRIVGITIGYYREHAFTSWHDNMSTQ